MLSHSSPCGAFAFQSPSPYLLLLAPPSLTGSVTPGDIALFSRRALLGGPLGRTSHLRALGSRPCTTPGLLSLAVRRVEPDHFANTKTGGTSVFCGSESLFRSCFLLPLLSSLHPLPLPTQCRWFSPLLPSATWAAGEQDVLRPRFLMENLEKWDF